MRNPATSRLQDGAVPAPGVCSAGHRRGRRGRARIALLAWLCSAPVSHAAAQVGPQGGPARQGAPGAPTASSVLATPAAGRPSRVVERALEQLADASAPLDQVLLRELWRAADQVDPTEVSEALGAVRDDVGAPAPRRAYAGILDAAAQRWRGDLAGSRRAVDALGYVTDWLVVGPFDNEGKAGLAAPSGPDGTLGEPVVLDRAFDGKRAPVRWRPAPRPSFAWLDFGALLRPRAYVCGWATTFVRVPAASTDGDRRIALWIGASGAFRLYWDGELVAWDEAYRGLDPDRIAVQVALTPGVHRLSVKACGDDDAASLAVRLAELDGSAAAGLTVEATVEASVEAASTLRAARGARGPRAPGPAPTTATVAVRPVETGPASDRAAADPNDGTLGEFGPTDPGRGAAPGALQACAAALRGRPNDAMVAEQVARYLLLTGGNPAGSHVTRDLARRAAEAAPSVDRLLLAGRLAEDRNGRRAWVDRAAALARTGAERVDVLLARAALARSSTNPLDASPLYDEVLRLDPSQIEATIGKAELYAEAGLVRTALAMVQRAVVAMPRSVALLRALAGQLRQLGRDTEAAEVESRYAALRFDDAGFLQLQVDLAAARNDRSGVDHWARRLLAVDATSAWALGVVARARRAVGDTPGALTAYDQALRAAPDDAASLRALADLRGETGDRAAQLRLLEQLLRIEPQAKDVRAYLDALRPVGQFPDEQMAWPAKQFLALRDDPAPAEERRTLRRLQVTTMLPGGLARRFHQIVFQPLTSEAAAAARQYAFAFHADRQIVEIKAAKVYRADGRVDEALETGSAPADEPALQMYTLQRVYYVQFPRLEVGDVVELRYRIEDVSSPDVLGDAFGESASLQGPDPTVDAEYVVIAPRETKLTIATSGAAQIERTERQLGTQWVYRFHARDLPGVRPEPAMPPWSELLASVQLSTFASWTDVARSYWGLAREQLDVDDEVRRRAQQLTAGLGSVREKVLAIYHFAANEIRYVGIEFGIEGIRPRRAALTLARGWGDCKDKATLIVSMLRELGIEAEIVLVRTNLRGRGESSVPSLFAFDHAIAYVPALDLYLDGTAEQTGAMELPGPDRGALALRINGAGGKLVTLPDAPPEASTENRLIELRLLADGSLQVKGTFEAQGAFAPGWRHRYAAESARTERIVHDLASLLGPVELGSLPSDLRFEGLDDLERPVRVVARAKARSHVEGDGWSVPMGTTERLVAEFGSVSRRAHPLLLGPKRAREERWTLELPAGHQARSVSPPVRLQSPFGTYERRVDQQGNRIEVSTSLSVSRSRIEPAEYAAWQVFITEVDRASASRVIVTR